jgi:hypothetical protein
MDLSEHAEPPLLYAETGLWWFWDQGGADRIAYPEILDLLEPDPDQPGRLRLDPAWEDHVLVAKHRLLQIGPERLVYRPTRRGVAYDLFDFRADPSANMARTPEGAARLRDLKEDLFQFLSREAGWRPQNGYWIPETLLRE